jgi:hypothetical protein
MGKHELATSLPLTKRLTINPRANRAIVAQVNINGDDVL